jgi:hypothetical protein
MLLGSAGKDAESASKQTHLPLFATHPVKVLSKSLDLTPDTREQEPPHDGQGEDPG